MQYPENFDIPEVIDKAKQKLNDYEINEILKVYWIMIQSKSKNS